MKRVFAWLLAAVMMLGLLAGCGETATPQTDAAADDVQMPELDGTEVTGEALPSEETAQQPEEEYVISSCVYSEGSEIPEGYTTYCDVVEHLFFHPVVAYPEVAFTSYKAEGIDDWMVTAQEYQKILQSLYDNGYILIDINDIWSEYTDENGEQRMRKNTLLLPEGKKPMVFSYDDVNYYEYMLETGFTYKLILGEDGALWSYGHDPQGNEVISQDLDAVTILDKFVREHPDFSPFGAKGCLSLTGYEGILGYRTQTDRDNTSAEFEANRQKEIEAVKPIVAELKRTGWTFACHTWGHGNLANRGIAKVTDDTQRWLDEVGSLVGETKIFIYPFGARLDGDDYKGTGECFRHVQSKGFRVFCSVGVESFAKVKDDICAVICDRLHPDGTTLRSAKCLETYGKFYDAREIIDLASRPKRDVGWL